MTEGRAFTMQQNLDTEARANELGEIRELTEYELDVTAGGRGFWSDVCCWVWYGTGNSNLAGMQG
jgi:hypothetical protein